MSEREFTREDFAKAFDEFGKYAFRLEALPEYRTEAELPLVRAYLSGDPLPPEDLHKDWLAQVRAKRDAGAHFERVRVLTEPLTPYLRYEIEWGYLLLASAGDEVSLIAPDRAASLELPGFDFWLFDDELGVHMLYGPNGEYEGVRRVDPKELDHCIRARTELLDAAEPLRDYLRRLRNA